VGVEAARKIKQEGLVLEEYLKEVSRPFTGGYRFFLDFWV
jgi:hypothetical protein